MPILYASFAFAGDAEKAAGALLDQGVKSSEISILTNEGYGSDRVVSVGNETDAITTTSGSDALMGAAKGLSVGMGLGIAGALVALTIPGLGLVIGSGAIAAAFGGAAATAAAGAAVGGIYGYLKDQGLSEDTISHYSNAVTNGGAILSLTVPLVSLPDNQAEGILLKYGASDVSTANPIPTQNTDQIPVTIPTLANVEPTETDPSTGEVIEGFVRDPSSGLKRLVRVEHGELIYMS